MPQRSSSEKETHQKKKVHARGESVREHEAILEALEVGIIVTSSDGLISAFNYAAEKLLGYSAAEVVGKTPILFHDTDEVVRRSELASEERREPLVPAFDVVIDKARRRKTADRQEWNFVRKDGSRFAGSLTIVPLTDEGGLITGYAEIISDTTELNEFKERSIASEQKFQLLAEHVPGAIYLCRNDALYSPIYINDHIKTITGYSAAEFLSGKTSIASLFHPDDRERIYETVNKSVASKKGFKLEYRIRHASGDWRWVSESGVGVYEKDELIMLEGFLQDITGQIDAAEKTKKVAEENLRFFNNPVNLNAVIDFEANLIRISPSWTKILGWTEEELKSESIFHIIHPDDADRTRSELAYLAKTGQMNTFENRLMCQDGSYRWLLWALAPDSREKIMFASAIDISARKKSEENILLSKSNLEGITLQLQEQNRRLDEFAHIISHNLRAPVNNIQALINLLDDSSEVSDYKLIFDKLKNVAKNLSETMNELMDTLKAKTQPHVDLTEIRFKEVLDKVVQSLEGELITAQASVTFDFNEAPLIRYSKPYLESIFQNLLTNAVKYKSPHRKPAIHFRSTVNDNHLELHVSDNGQGIDMEKFGDKLFGLHKTFHQHQEARGVGLFLVKTQVEALGGTISAQSQVDQGTTFIIRFN